MMKWQEDALHALDNARADVMAANEPVIMAIITVTDADLIGDRPVSFYANVKTLEWLGTFLRYCSDRIKAKYPEALPSPHTEKEG